MAEKWWESYPWRMIQTNMRQIDMLDIDAKVYVQQLLDFDANVVLINTSGIIASYETKLPFHFQSEYLKGDNLKQIIDLCHENGIKVMARTDFSKIRRPIYQQHPDWAYRRSDGEVVDYNGDVHACLNGGYQSEYAFEIMKETMEELNVDGVFCNMGGFQVKDYSYNYHGICHCDNCKVKFKEMFGMDLPLKEDMNDPVFRKYSVFKEICLQQHKNKMVELIKGINPEVAIAGDDFERMESNTEYGRDLPHWQYSAASNTRTNVGTDHDVTSSNTTVDFIGFWYRHVAVSAPLQELRMWQDLSGLGGLDYYLIGRLDNHEDQSGYEGIKKVFKFHAAHQDFYQGLHSSAKTLLVRAQLWGDAKEERGMIRVLTESHISFDETLASRLESANLDKYSLIVLPDTKYLSDAAVEKLDKFVEDGNMVLATGESGYYDGLYEERTQPGLQCLGIKTVLEKRDDMLSSMIKLTGTDAEVFTSFEHTSVVAVDHEYIYADYEESTTLYGKLIPPHPIGPPERCCYDTISDLPGVVKNKYGKGYGIYIPSKPGGLYYQEGYENTFWFIKDILINLCDQVSLAQGLTPMVQVSVSHHDDNDAVIQLVNNSGHFGTSYFAPLPIYDFIVCLPDSKQPTAVTSIKTGKVLQFEYQEGVAKVFVDKLEEYDAIHVLF